MGLTIAATICAGSGSMGVCAGFMGATKGTMYYSVSTMGNFSRTRQPIVSRPRLLCMDEERWFRYTFSSVRY